MPEHITKNSICRYPFINVLIYIFSVHIVALLLFTAIRLALFSIYDYNFPDNITTSIKAIAFVKGIWFDNVVCCYITILPLTLAWLLALFNYIPKWFYRLITCFYIITYSIALSIATGNIPYFSYFFKTINSSIFEWIETTDVAVKMIAEERSYIAYIIFGASLIIAFSITIIKLMRLIYSRKEIGNRDAKYSLLRFITIFVTGSAIIGLCIFGIRGRMGYNPIKVSQAYYCTDPFLNQLGVNPVFNLLTSTLDERRKENRQLHLIDPDIAVKYVQKSLNRDGIDGISPIARVVTNDSSYMNQNGAELSQQGRNKKNVVIIFMESLSANLLKRYGNRENLTPFLDSLHSKSLSFNNIYSSGIHTNHGLYSTLYSFPSIMKRNAMKGSVIPIYSGLPTVLKDNGYHNIFFMTHESQYDNMNAFLRTNGFDEIFSQESYPPDKIVNSFGVQDDFLFDYAINILNDRAKNNKPFFAALLSISNHPPYIVPNYFKPTKKDIQQQIVEYADWSIKRFMERAMRESWFNNTIFVLLGDHGKLVGDAECEVPQSYNHIPLIIFGKDIEPAENESFGNQTDIAPTLLDLLKINYTQNNFGIDLLKERREYTFYCSDNQIVCRDSSSLYIYEPNTQNEILYNISKEGLKRADIHDNSKDDTKDCTNRYENIRKYVYSMLQTTEQLVKSEMTTDKCRTNN